ncbi:MAG: relaxase/mobilization nuclease domain-containing protein [Faecalibacterium sp.]
MAATRLIALHKNKGKSVAACLKSRTDYAQNPDKTNKGELVSNYACSPLTVDEEFMLTKRLYERSTGRIQKSDVIAYQVRQSFKPGEVTPEEANRIGYEFAERFLKGKYAFIVATHTDRAHIHNHILYNSTALDGTRKFKNFWLSSFAVQRLSDRICLEHQLSVIKIKPYRERQKRIPYPPKESNRERLCGVIDTILMNEKPADFEAFLSALEQQGYEIKRGKYTSVKGPRQKRFIRFKTLGEGYSEEEIKAVIAGEAEHRPHQKQPPKEQPFQLLVDIQAKMAEGKGEGYKKWAAKHNLKEMSKTLLFLQEQKIGSAEELRERAAAATERYHAMGDSIKAAEARLTEIAVLKNHIINYAKTREVYTAYRKAGYSKAFQEAHREEITLHKAAKAAFDGAGLQKLPKIKELDAEFAELLTKKKAAYPDYRKARNEMQELVRAQKNVERFFAEEKDTIEKTQTR